MPAGSATPGGAELHGRPRDGYGYTAGKSIADAYLAIKHAVLGPKAAAVAREPLFDPK